jgi:hypothetical protein
LGKLVSILAWSHMPRTRAIRQVRPANANGAGHPARLRRPGLRRRDDRRCCQAAGVSKGLLLPPRQGGRPRAHPRVDGGRFRRTRQLVRRWRAGSARSHLSKASRSRPPHRVLGAGRTQSASCRRSSRGAAGLAGSRPESSSRCAASWPRGRCRFDGVSRRPAPRLARWADRAGSTFRHKPRSQSIRCSRRSCPSATGTTAVTQDGLIVENGRQPWLLVRRQEGFDRLDEWRADLQGRCGRPARS